MSTPGLSLPHLSPSQSGKTTSVNVIADGLDGALTQMATIDVSGSADITPSPSTVTLYMCLQLTGILTGNIHLILPSKPHLYFVQNLVPYRPWAASTTYSLGQQIVDPAGHIQQVTSGSGSSGSSIPTFNDSGGTTVDNGLTWTDQGAAMSYTVTVKCGTGSTVIFDPGDVKVIYCDGTNVITTS